MTGSNRNLIGRVLAFVVGVVWFVLLIFGGWGLIFGPMGWLAALFGRRFPRLSAALLVIPSIFLLVSWGLSLILLAESPSNVVQGLAIVAILVGPALVAAVLIVRGARTVPAAAAT